ncbi:MAG: tryptophan--tRNA ligase, partial [Planctomycetota bacterium]|nr:tryptophan--tRNA ligase [Planctomycetota bacterium]
PEVSEDVNAMLAPLRRRRGLYEGDDDAILDILKAGCARAIEVAEETLAMAKDAACLKFFDRKLRYR